MLSCNGIKASQYSSVYSDRKLFLNIFLVFWFRTFGSALKKHDTHKFDELLVFNFSINCCGLLIFIQPNLSIVLFKRTCLPI